MTEETSNVQNVTENVQPVAAPATNTEKTHAVTMKTIIGQLMMCPLE